jgi:hypothetical protein
VCVSVSVYCNTLSYFSRASTLFSWCLIGKYGAGMSDRVAKLCAMLFLCYHYPNYPSRRTFKHPNEVKFRSHIANI